MVAVALMMTISPALAIAVLALVPPMMVISSHNHLSKRSPRREAEMAEQLGIRGKMATTVRQETTPELFPRKVATGNPLGE